VNRIHKAYTTHKERVCRERESEIGRDGERERERERDFLGRLGVFKNTGLKAAPGGLHSGQGPAVTRRRGITVG